MGVKGGKQIQQFRIKNKARMQMGYTSKHEHAGLYLLSFLLKFCEVFFLQHAPKGTNTRSSRLGVRLREPEAPSASQCVLRQFSSIVASPLRSVLGCTQAGTQYTVLTGGIQAVHRLQSAYPFSTNALLPPQVDSRPQRTWLSLLACVPL